MAVCSLWEFTRMVLMRVVKLWLEIQLQNNSFLVSILQSLISTWCTI